MEYRQAKWDRFAKSRSRLRAGHAKRLTIESLEFRRVLAGNVVISEIMASNDNDIRDEDHNRPDWIELLNTTDSPVDLDGWFLTDDEGDLDKWRLPAVELAAQERVVVFASGKNRAPVDGELHSNFRLNAEGSYVAIVQPDGISVEFDFAPTYPPQAPDVSFGMPQEVRQLQLVDAGGPARVFVPTTANGGDKLGQTWTSGEFDDTSWDEATNAIGYENLSNYEDIFTTDMGSKMFEVNSSAFMRVPFELESGRSVFSLTLGMQYDDGYVAYINGQEVIRRNAPESVEWNSAATDAHSDRVAVVFEDAGINVFDFNNLLVDGTNILAIHALNDDIASSDFLMVPRLTARSFAQLQTDAQHYFNDPTPGEPNGIGTSVAIHNATHSPRVPDANSEIRVTASVTSTAAHVSNVTLHYRAMYDAEQTLIMFDDGQHGDGSSGDRIFGATIPAGVASPGQMVRYYITATAGDDTSARLPVFADPLETEQYLGTVIADPSIDSDIKVFHWFLEDPDGKDSNAGTRGSLFHDGKFYDNVLIDTTGRTVGLAGPKKSHDVFLPSDHWFELEIDNQIFRMNDFDLISDYWNRAKVRVPLGYQTLGAVGTPSHYSIPVRVQENGEFYATYSFVDGGNEQFLQRAGLDPGGALYKMNLGFSTARGVYKKQTRNFEDASDLREFFNGLALSGEDRRQFLMDNVNISATVNYLVGLVIMGHGDCCNKNLYIYRDTETNGEWEPLPWDVDSAFGRGGVGLAQSVFPTAAALFTGLDNSLFKALFDDVPEFREMYLRRMRTLMDQFVQLPETPTADLYFEARVDAMAADLASSAALDFEKWGSWYTDPATEFINHGKEGVPTWQEQLDVLKFEYFPARRTFLYNSLRQANGGVQLAPQTVAPSIKFGAVESNPESGDQDEEYIVLQNPNDFAVDITDWVLTGAVRHRFDPGTVIPSGGSLYVSPNVNAFRTRTSGPSGGQGLYIEGNYTGRIPNQGATLRLVASDLTIVDEVTTSVNLTATQQFLRITELMYNPRSAEQVGRFENDDFEFVELMNTSFTETLELEHVQLSDGIEFSFPAYSLAPRERAVVVRDTAAFIHRYGDLIPIIGEYGRTADSFSLSNGGESIRLQIGPGDLIQEFTYDDAWHRQTDGQGSSLVITNPEGDLNAWSRASGWKPSEQVDGTPGSGDIQIADFNEDGDLDADDIDLFCTGFRTGDMRFDLVDDDQVNEVDLVFLIRNLMGSAIGDSNLDGVFNSRDFVTVFQVAEYEDAVDGNSTWADGDWNCDGDFTTTDLVFAFQMGDFVAAATTTDPIQKHRVRSLVAAAVHDDHPRLAPKPPTFAIDQPPRVRERLA